MMAVALCTLWVSRTAADKELHAATLFMVPEEETVSAAAPGLGATAAAAILRAVEARRGRSHSFAPSEQQLLGPADLGREPTVRPSLNGTRTP